MKHKQPQLTDAERKLLALGLKGLLWEVASDGPEMQPVRAELAALQQKLEGPATRFSRRDLVLLYEACLAGRRGLERALTNRRDNCREAQAAIDMWLHYDVIREQLKSHLPNKRQHT